jgi:hypothetical protein
VVFRDGLPVALIDFDHVLPRAEAWLRAAAPAITARLTQPG